jgi:polysaccharide biosynthesis/export protein
MTTQRISIAFLIAFVLTSVAAAQQLLPAGAPTQPATSPAPVDYVIGPQDVLAISLFDQPELGGKFTVELDGTFSFPLVGRVTARGLTIRQFETSLRTTLVEGGFFKAPQLTVGVDQYRSQRVFVVGEVRTPGTYPLTRDTTLIELLSRAGSTTPSASDEVVVVRSQGGNAPSPVVLDADDPALDVLRINLKDLQSGTISRNVDLHDGDTVYVARAEEVYVFGEVKNPGSYSIKSGTTVLQALSLAGGVTPSGAIGRLKIVRFVNGRKSEVNSRLTDIVQPGDTITVPERLF